MATTTARALLGGQGPSWVPDTIPVPDPGPGQVRIRVEAAALNRVDMYMLEGTYNADTTRTYTAGRECAGMVTDVGPGVAEFARGDRVMCAVQGAFTDYVLCDSRHVLPIPTGVSAIEAASLPIALGTEHDALIQAGFQPGQSVLILGGTSSIGIVGIRMAKALGAPFVAATTTSDAKASALTTAGADRVINTRSEDVGQVLLDATDGHGVDVVLDHLAGQPLADSLKGVAVGGTVVNIGRLAGRESTINLDDLSFRRVRLIGTTFSVRTADERAEVYQALHTHVLPAVAAGLIRPVIDQVYPFEEYAGAAERMRSNAAIGKIVLALTDTEKATSPMVADSEWSTL